MYGRVPGLIPMLREFTPRYHEWEALSDGVLITYANYRLFELEMECVNSDVFNRSKAIRAFAAGYTAVLVMAYKSCVFPLRNQGKRRAGMEMIFGVIMASLGVILGCFDESLHLTELLARAHKNRLFFDYGEAPILEFMLRLLIDYYGGIELPAPMTDLPIHNQLLTEWRNPDFKRIENILMDVCDIHTHHCGWPDSSSRFMDFETLRRTPIEVLLVLRLRERLGLENLEINHPLMNTALGKLPTLTGFDEIGCGPDDLIARVRSRMMLDEYDEDQIFKMCCSAW